MPPAILLADIAASAGVSVSTVSRYLNNKPVSSQAAERIQKSIDSNPGAPLPKLRKSKARLLHGGSAVNDICVLLVDLPENVSIQPAFSEIIAGVQRGAARQRKSVLFTSYNGSGPLPEELTEREYGGFLVLDRGNPPSREMMALLRSAPTVYMLHRFRDERGEFDSVHYDNRMVGEIAADYLRQQRCETFLFASHVNDHPAFIQRRNEFSASLLAAGVSDVQIVEESDPTKMRERLVQIFSQGNRPDGVFAAADDALVAAWFAAKLANAPIAGNSDHTGIRFIGCNNDQIWLRQMSPCPATIDIQLPEIGERAVDQLIWRREHREASRRMQIVLSPQLLIPDHATVFTPVTETHQYI